jgi:hypothetical protein
MLQIPAVVTDRSVAQTMERRLGELGARGGEQVER